MFRWIVLAACSWFALAAIAAAQGVPGERISFKRTHIDPKFRSEGVAVGDFNGDGRLDIAAGNVYYAAPDWRLVPIEEEAKEYNINGYSLSFANWAEDINGDGRVDLVVVEWPGRATWWYENPGKEGAPWKKHLATPVTSNETPLFVDVTGDGRRELVCGVAPHPDQSDGPDRQMAIIFPRADGPWTIHPISEKGAPGTQRYAHGLGVGDIDGDGRRDVVTRQGWWQQPEDPTSGPWTFHPAPLGEDCADMVVYDFDGDGLADVLSSSAHRYGIWWHQRLADGGWKTHTIADDFSQTHAVILADINGDGLKDFVTGKRFWAHNGADPGAREPALLCWFELKREDGKPVWTRHVIDDESGVGTQFQIIDINGNGLLDIVVSNKKGVFVFEQQRN